MREKPRSNKPRRLADWLNPTGSRKVHSLVDKVYKPKIEPIFETIFEEANFRYQMGLVSLIRLIPSLN